MEEQSQINLVEEVTRKDQQLERLRQAYTELQQQTQQQQQQLQQLQQQQTPPLRNSSRENVLQTINHLPVFTGTGDVTVNSFFCSTEYLLSTIREDNLRREAVKLIFYKTIQGQAKDAVINIPEPDNWTLIKETLKLRYRPNVEPHQIYKMLSNLRVNTVSELITEIQNIKYKADELTVYYHNDHYIDLSNVDSILVNTVKEMTQGILLDKIYDERNINDILKILTRRRFEDSCIREEYKKIKTIKFNNTNSNRNTNYKTQGNFNNNYNHNFNPSYNRNYNPNFKNNQINNSGRYRVQNNAEQYRTQNNSGNFQRLPQPGNPRNFVNQNRFTQPRQGQEPMEIDNIQINNVHGFSQQVGNPRQYCSPNYCKQFRQDQRMLVDNKDTTSNYSQTVQVDEQEMKSNLDNRHTFFQRPPPTIYPS